MSTINSIGVLFHEPFLTPTDNNGKPMPNAVWYFYTTNSTAGALAYSSANLTGSFYSVTADATGTFAPIYLNPNIQYRARLFNSSGQLIQDVDPVNAPTLFSGSAVKTVSTNQTNTIVMTADADLQVNVPGPGWYRVEADLTFTVSVAGLTPGVAVNFGSFALGGNCPNSVIVEGEFGGTDLLGSNGPSAYVSVIVVPGALSPNFGANPNGIAAATGAAAQSFRMTALVQLSGAGVLSVLWSNGTSGAGTTTLVQGSSLTVQQLA